MTETIEAKAVGEVHSGKVTSVKRFGVFVAIGEVEGLVDSWWIRENAVEWPTLGETVRVRIEELREDGKLTLSLVI